MTFQQDLTYLIAEIDRVLPKASSGLAWFKSSTGDVNAQRRVLEQVRKYLIELQKKSDGQEHPEVKPNQQPEPIQQVSTDLVKEINSLRDILIKPLQADIEALRQQRESLEDEVRQIEAQRQYYNSLGQQQAKQQQIISEFAQVLMGHLQESLTRQITHTLVDVKTQVLSSEMAASDWGGENRLQETIAAASPSTYPLPPQERLELVRQMQAQSDRLLIDLDATIRTVLATLQHSIYAYQESLSSGVTRMHSLGQQSEMLLTTIVDRLTQRATAGASVDLEPLPLPEPSPSVPTDETIQPEVATQTDTQPTEVTAVDTSQQQLPLPFPGMELPSQSPETPQQTSTELEDFQPATENPKITESLPDTDDVAIETQQFEAWEIIEELELSSLDIEPIEFDEKDISDWQLEVVELPAALSEDLLLEDAISITTSEVQPNLQIDRAEAATDDTRLEPPIDTTANLNQTQPANLPITSLSNPQEQNLSTTTIDASQTTGTDLQVAAVSNQQPHETSEEVQTITALTDLFEDMFLDKEQMLLLGMGQEISSNDQESAADVLTQYIPQLDIESYPDVEDSYIPASPDEHLFVKEESNRESDINLWLDEGTIQQLGQDLSSFESFKFPDAPVQQPLELDRAEHSTRDTSQLPPAANSSEETLNLNVLPWQLLTSNELLGEDWQDFEVEGFVAQNYSPHLTVNTTVTSAATPSSDVSAYDITQLPTSSAPTEVPQNTVETTQPTELNAIEPVQDQAQQDLEPEIAVSQPQSESLSMDQNAFFVPPAAERLSETLDTLSGSTLSAPVSSDQSNNITNSEAPPESENAN